MSAKQPNARSDQLVTYPDLMPAKLAAFYVRELKKIKPSPQRVTKRKSETTMTPGWDFGNYTVVDIALDNGDIVGAAFTVNVAADETSGNAQLDAAYGGVIATRRVHGVQPGAALSVARGLVWDVVEHLSRVKNSTPKRFGELSSPRQDAFREGAARAFWSDLYMTAVEELQDEEPDLYDELSPGPGGDWDSLVPEIPPEAYRDAEAFEREVKTANNVDAIDKLMREAARADGVTLEDLDADEFGWGLAMPALGHGVSWFDDHGDFLLKLPHWSQSVGMQNAMYDYIEAQREEADE